MRRQSLSTWRAWRARGARVWRRLRTEEHGHLIVPYSAPSPAPPDPSATLWVATTGDDSRSKATVAASAGSLPWATIGRAAWGSTNRAAPNTAEAAAAGDVVSIAAGTYSVAGTDNRFESAYNPANSGTAGNLITFQAAGVVNLQLSSSLGPVIGAAGRNYIKWSGFNIDEATCTPRPDTGSVVFNASTGSQLHRTTIKASMTAFADNHNGVRIEGCEGILIKNNLIYDVGDDGTYGQNSAAVMLYDANDTIIEHNEFRTCGVGVFVKGQHATYTQRRTIIRYNLITGMYYAGLDLLADYSGKHHQNIIRDGNGANNRGIKIYELGAGEGGQPQFTFIVNNTIDACALGLDMQGQGTSNEAHNNLFTNGTIGLASDGPTVSPLTGISFTRDLYFGNGNMAVFDRDGANVTYTFATWQSTFTQDTNGSSADPLYVNTATNDFHLQAGSPALTLGRVVQGIGGTNGDTIPAGAYITGSETIGIQP